MDEIRSGTSEVECDVLVIGGGTAGPMAAYKAKQKNPQAHSPAPSSTKTARWSRRLRRSPAGERRQFRIRSG